MSACDVSIDIDATLLTQLEHIQKLLNLHRRVLIDLDRQWLPGDVDDVAAAVQQSCLLVVESFISESSKALTAR
ncbi:uncharacterized protein ARMOST_08661 [Armillaria ostoyae]|uniref:Uncharacterized protein n=1 Tax=Armillaria ostoyae TaxID=47428 RepID=A0A284R999_ARMOS|nr:uncharacterized protein ARMOST_08661 [Armillaria ostoyae]